jgi:hypothetical protein
LKPPSKTERLGSKGCTLLRSDAPADDKSSETREKGEKGEKDFFSLKMRVSHGKEAGLSNCEKMKGGFFFAV